MWHIQSKRVGLCWNSTDTPQWHIHHSERGKKMNSTPDRYDISHFICQSAVTRHQERSLIVTFHCWWIKMWKLSHPQLMAHIYISMFYAMSHRTLQDQLKVKLLQSDAVLESLRHTVICHSPHMKAPLAVAAWLSARWQWDFNRQELFVTKQIVTNLWDKYRIARPPCFNLSFFCLLFR